MSPFISESAVPAAARNCPLPVAGPPDPEPTVPVRASPVGQRERLPPADVKCRRICVANGAHAGRQTTVERAKKRFFKLCRQREILVTETFYKVLKLCPCRYKAQLFSKAACFFASVDTSRVTSTATLTGMIYRGGGKASTGTAVAEFVKIADADIQAVASLTHLRSISSMYNGRGFPSVSDVSALLDLQILHNEEGLDERLLSSISSMCSRRRGPPLRDLQALLTLPSLQWRGRPCQQVLRVISNINHGKGLPSCQAVNDLLLLPCLREEKGVFDMLRLRTLSVMCRRKGIPELGHVVSLFDLIESYGMLHKKLLECFRSLYRGKGVPDPEEQLRLLRLPALQRDGHLDLKLLVEVAVKNVSAGFPTEGMVQQAVGRLRRCEGRKLSVGLVKIVPRTSTAETSSVPTTVVPGQAATTMSGQCQPVPVAQGAADVVKPSPQDVAAIHHDGSRLLNGGASDASIAEQERRRRINAIINYLLNDDPSSAASIRPAYWTEELSSSAKSEVLDWLEEIINADCSSPGQCLGPE